ncbi:hypothetical protein [Enterococcus faecalis]|uniref:hypothetical protein n=1 Tax=Enterococcus faecalis TaxID=1351 RepID=UPI002DB93953|nr:hypothetical protein [Enterococcus faecalis]MEB7792190.1 hypothetical protein [Enterococcus faecalis]MEB7810210.1 hypothetical protein [Enterococcus faecalis]
MKKNEDTQFFLIRGIQILILLISLTGAVLYQKSQPNWPTYLSLFGIVLGSFIPRNYKVATSGIYLKKHTRRLENIIETTIITLITLLIYYIGLS